MVLGSSSLTVREMIRAYSVFPTLGDIQESFFISRIESREGAILEETSSANRVHDVVDDNVAFVMVTLLQDVVRVGTATKARELGPLAGKTGTTNDFKDAPLRVAALRQEVADLKVANHALEDRESEHHSGGAPQDPPGSAPRERKEIASEQNSHTESHGNRPWGEVREGGACEGAKVLQRQRGENRHRRLRRPGK